ncbi:unnamed protein product [Schistosoma curassoni]|uniref:Ovule protein n=1 Tax=Schistosoma curassoni TaxID=6186 RepID=A0A183KWX3_9TREM|nr:unnamed protein product [Schistosoma curassoni]
MNCKIYLFHLHRVFFSHYFLGTSRLKLLSVSHLHKVVVLVYQDVDDLLQMTFVQLRLKGERKIKLYKQYSSILWLSSGESSCLISVISD